MEEVELSEREGLGLATSLLDITQVATAVPTSTGKIDLKGETP
jgi:hypothetical protein